MRIVAIRDIVSPIRSNIANAYIDFSQMTASVVAIETDLKVEGKPVIGYGFNSNGRYAQKGLLGERFIPRLKQAKPDSLLDGEGLLDPAKCWAAMMANEKPGGHGERSVAVGVLDMALWDAVAKAKRVPLWKLLADRYNGGKSDDKAWVYAAGGYYYPGKDLDGLQDEMKHYLDLGYSCVKMKVGGVPLAEDLKRIEAVLKIVGLGRPARRRRQRQVRPADRDRVRQGDRRLTACAGTRSRSIRSTISRTARSPPSTPRRSPPARTCSPCRTRATWCAMPASGPTATSCNTTRPCPTAWSSTCAPSTC